jgi:phosphatidylinositol 4-kinase
VYEFHSECTDITLQLTDDYKVRNDILGQLQRNANTWFELALSRAPIELQSTLQVRFVLVIYSFSFMFSLQKYLAATQPLIGADAAELGASVAETFAKASGPVHRQLCRCSVIIDAQAF